MQNRQIKFRGRRINTPEWVYGFIIGSLDPTKEEDVYRAWFIHEGVSIKEAIRVDPETIGQFTGLLDKNGNEIYKGDIVTFTDGNYRPILLIKWFDSLTWDSRVSSHPGFFFKQKWHDESNECEMDYHLGFDNGLEIIGNIHEHPELLNQ